MLALLCAASLCSFLCLVLSFRASRSSATDLGAAGVDVICADVLLLDDVRADSDVLLLDIDVALVTVRAGGLRLGKVLDDGTALRKWLNVDKSLDGPTDGDGALASVRAGVLLKDATRALVYAV